MRLALKWGVGILATFLSAGALGWVQWVSTTLTAVNGELRAIAAAGVVSEETRTKLWNSLVEQNNRIEARLNRIEDKIDAKLSSK